MNDWVVMDSQRRAPHEGSGGYSLNAANAARRTRRAAATVSGPPK